MTRKPTAALLLVMLIGISGCGPEKVQNTATLEQQQSPFIPPKARHGRHVFAGNVLPPAQPLQNPYQGNAQMAESGRRLFTTLHCDSCHGPGAVGSIGPSLEDGRWRYGASSAELFESIFAGRANGMPAFGGMLPKEAIWQLVTYLQTLKPEVDPATTTFPSH